MEFEQLFRERYSCRSFSDQPVAKELLEKLLESARLAPTAKNQQPFKIYVLQSEEALKKVDEATPCRYNAPTVLGFVYDTEKEWKNPNNSNHHSGNEDVAIVATHVMLEAKNIGLDSCWVKYFDNEKFESLFDLPSTEKSVLLLPVGYGKIGPGPLHKNKKDISELVEYR